MSEMTADQYADQLFGEGDPLFDRMAEEAAAQGIPQIQVPHELGRLLSVLAAACGARTALEIGTLFGQSGTILARALQDGGTLTTLEVSPHHAEAARSNFERAGVGDRVVVVEGDALDSLQALHERGQQFDLIFIDADKPGYPTYLDFALKLAHPGTVIVADNVWRGGRVADAGGDEGNAALAAYNHTVAGNPALVSTIVPTRAGGDAAIVSVVKR